MVIPLFSFFINTLVKYSWKIFSYVKHNIVGDENVILKSAISNYLQFGQIDPIESID